MEIGLHLINLLYLVHELACVEAEAVEEHLFAEDVHFLNSDEQGNHTGANDGAGPMHKSEGESTAGYSLHLF